MFSYFHQEEVIRYPLFLTQTALLMADVRQHRELFIRTISLRDNAFPTLVNPTFQNYVLWIII